MRHSNQVPLWLRRLDLVKAELKGVRFPRTAEEGLRQCAELSDTALRLLQDEIRKTRARANKEQVEVETYRLLARLSRAEARWRAVWKKERDRFFRP